MAGLDDFLSRYGMIGAEFDPTQPNALPDPTGPVGGVLRRGVGLARRQAAYDEGDMGPGRRPGAFKPEPGTFSVRPGTFSVQPGTFANAPGSFSSPGGMFMPTGSTQQRQAMADEYRDFSASKRLGMM